MTMTSFKRSAENSRRLFAKFVEPALKRFGFADIISTENHSEPLKKILDFAGIDALARQDDMSVGLASRVIQKKSGCVDYKNFSLRDKRINGKLTELEKLRSAIKANSLRPQWHIQTFVDEDERSAIVALCPTRKLIDYAGSHELKTKVTNDGTIFRLAPWRDLKKAGINVRLFQIDIHGKAKKITA